MQPSCKNLAKVGQKFVQVVHVGKRLNGSGKRNTLRLSWWRDVHPLCGLLGKIRMIVRGKSYKVT